MYEIKQTHDASTTNFGANIPYSGLEWHSTAKPEYLVYVFNCSERTFCDPQDPLKGLIGRIKLLAPGLLPDDPTEVMVSGKTVQGNANHRYHYVTSFPQPMLIPKFNDESCEIETKETDVRRFVVDMISPDNLTLSLDATIDPSKAFSQGNDYAPRGLFFSYSNPPAKEDVEKAYARMERYYSQLNEIAGTLEQTDKVELQRRITMNPDHLYAANYYGKPFAWARKSVRPVDCPNCGEQKPAGRLWHTPSTGGICVEPTVAAWKAVVLSGNRTRDAVPLELRWWEDKTAQSTQSSGSERLS
jgi:hypothetical protein